MRPACRHCDVFQVGIHDDGNFRSKCCYKCKFNYGTTHGRDCEGILVLRQLPMPPPATPPAPPAAHTALQIPIQRKMAQPRTPPSPPHDAPASSSNVVADPSPRTSLCPFDHPLDSGHIGHHCILVTMGLRHYRHGHTLLQQNPGLRRHLVDATTFLFDRGDLRYNRRYWGTHLETQVSVSKMVGFDSLLMHVLGRILMDNIIIVSCDNGHHRSVAVAEVAYQRMSHLQSSHLQILKIHVDANECTDEQWRVLCAYGGNTHSANSPSLDV